MTDPVRTSYEWQFLTRHWPTAFERPFLMELYGENVQDACDGIPDFALNLHAAAMSAIDDDDTTLVRQGLLALAHVGTLDDVPRLKQLLNHPESLVARDTKTCIFEISHG